MYLDISTLRLEVTSTDLITDLGIDMPGLATSGLVDAARTAFSDQNIEPILRYRY
jgi:hypothetical protein